MKQRLAIAQVLMEDEPILIMDEPMNGLDREGIKDIRELILEEKERGKLFYWQAITVEILNTYVMKFMS